MPEKKMFLKYKESKTMKGSVSFGTQVCSPDHDPYAFEQEEAERLLKSFPNNFEEVDPKKIESEAKKKALEAEKAAEKAKVEAEKAAEKAKAENVKKAKLEGK